MNVSESRSNGEQIVKYNKCDYRCYVKQLTGRSGTVYDRAFCRKVDPECAKSNGRLRLTERPIRSKKPITDMKALMADMRLVIADSREGKTQADLMHIFKDYAPFEVGQALSFLIRDAQIAKIGKNLYVSTDPRISTEPQTNIARAQEIISIIETFPAPLTVTQTFGTKHFHKYKKELSNRVIVGYKYIGVPSTGVLKTFRPKLTEQLMKLSKKWGFDLDDERIMQRYDAAIEEAPTGIEWKLVGIIPQTKVADPTATRRAMETELGSDLDNTAIFISCKTGQITQVNARGIHIVEDACDNARYYSGGTGYIMVAECNGEQVMATMPLKMPLLKGTQQAMTELLC